MEELSDKLPLIVNGKFVFTKEEFMKTYDEEKLKNGDERIEIRKTTLCKKPIIERNDLIKYLKSIFRYNKSFLNKIFKGEKRKPLISREYLKDLLRENNYVKDNYPKKEVYTVNDEAIEEMNNIIRKRVCSVNDEYKPKYLKKLSADDLKKINKIFQSTILSTYCDEDEIIDYSDEEIKEWRTNTN